MIEVGSWRRFNDELIIGHQTIKPQTRGWRLQGEPRYSHAKANTALRNNGVGADTLCLRP
jgi:hypothetical protein